MLVATTAAAPANAITELRERGCEVVTVPADDAGRPALLPLLSELGRRRWTNLLVEGGSGVLSAFMDANAIDEVHVFVAPLLIGGVQAQAPIEGSGVTTIKKAQRFQGWQVEQVDGDVYWRGWV